MVGMHMHYIVSISEKNWRVHDWIWEYELVGQSFNVTRGRVKNMTKELASSFGERKEVGRRMKSLSGMKGRDAGEGCDMRKSETLMG
ncbi:hypothetical protein ACLOJK_001112 [Asimina triloba]